MSKKFKMGGFKTPIHNLLINDGLRPALEHAYIKDGYVVATDAHILIKQSLVKFHGMSEEEAEILEGKFLSKDLLKQLWNRDIISFKKDEIYTVKDGVKAVFEYGYQDYTYVKYENVIPTETKEVELIGINGAYVGMLTKLMTESGSYRNDLHFKFHGQTKAILVSTPNYSISENLGLIMPVMIDKNY